MNQINITIHEFLGNPCFHPAAIQWLETEPDYQCKACGKGIAPDYCSEENPRSLLDNVVKELTKTSNDIQGFHDSLFEILFKEHENDDVILLRTSCPTTLQLAKACVKEIEYRKNNILREERKYD